MIKGLGPHPNKWCLHTLRRSATNLGVILNNSTLSHPIVNLLENPKTQTLLRSCHSSVQNVPVAPMLHTKPESLHWPPALYDLAPLSLLSLLTHSAPATLATVLFLKHAKHPSASGPLHLLCPQTEPEFYILTLPPAGLCFNAIIIDIQNYISFWFTM